MVEGSKEKHHISLKDHFTQHDPHKHQHEEVPSSAGKTSASAMKTDDKPAGEEPKEEHKKKEGLWSRYQNYVSEKNAKETNDDIWGHYRGPGH